MTKKLFISAYLTLIVCITAVHFLGWEMGDKGWYLMIAHSWLNGEQLYVDRAEVSLPLIYLLYAGVIKAAAVTNMPDYHMLTLATVLLAGFITFVCSVLHVHSRHAGEGRFAVLLLLPTVFVVWANPGYFGDRDHLLLLLIFPYLYVLSPEVERKNVSLPRRMLAAGIAILGFCIKPHAVIFLALALLLVALREKSLRVVLWTENLFIYGAGLLYLGCIRVMFPAYFLEIMPMAGATYDAIKNPIGHIFYYLPPLLTLLAVVVDFRPRADSPYRRDAQYWLALALGGFAYAALNNGWIYTFYPVNALVLVCAFYIWRHFRWLAANEPLAQKAKKARLGANSCLFAISANLLYIAAATLVFLLNIGNTDPIEQHRQCATKLADELKEYDASTYGILSINPAPWSILYREHGARLVTRYANLWMLPKVLLLRNTHPEYIAWVQKAVADNIAADIAKNRPDMIFEQILQSETPNAISAVFAAIVSFDTSFADYEPVAEVKMDDPIGPKKEGAVSECHFRIYVRKPRD